MSLLPDTIFAEMYTNGDESVIVVNRDQVTGSISFEAGKGIKNLNAEMRQRLHERLDAFLTDEITK